MMTSRPSFTKAAKLALGPSLLAFLVMSGFAFQQERRQVSLAGELAWDHLNYALSLQDDMGLIDWGRGLERMEGIQSFRYGTSSKTMIEGGNQDRLPAATTEGVHFLFPSGWLFEKDAAPGTKDPGILLLVYHPSAGPLAWGSLGMTIVLLTSFLSWALQGRSSQEALPTPTPSAREIPRRDRGDGDPLVPVGALPPYSLFIDSSYVIRQAAPGTATLFGKEPEALMDHHLLDLAPTPLLVQSIERGQGSVEGNAFPSQPDLKVTLKAVPNGTFLILERTSRSKPS